MNFRVAIFITVFIAGCTWINPKSAEKKGMILAEVGSSKLYMSEIQDIINPSSDEDSADIIANYINNWVSKQLVLQKAMEQLPGEIEEIEKKVNDYKESLIIYRYEQELIKKRLKSELSEEEIKNYFEQYKNNFILEFDILNLSYVKLLSNSPTKDSVKLWFRSDKLEDKLKLEEFCSQYAIAYNIDEENWIERNSVNSILNMEDSDLESQLWSRNEVSMEKDNNLLFIKVSGKRLKGSEAPLEYVQDDVKKILLNKRKLLLIDDIHQRILEEGEKQKKFKVHFNS